VIANWQSTVFRIADASRILAAVRVSVAITVVTWVIVGPFPSFYPLEEALLYSPQSLAALLPPLGNTLFNGLKATVALGCIGMLWQHTSVEATRLTATSFAVLNCYVAGFSDLWNYNTHLNTFLFALSFAPKVNTCARSNSERCSAIVFFMRLQVSVIYLQSGLAKIIHGGWEWSASAPYVHLILHGGWVAPWVNQSPRLVAACGVVVVVIELLLPLLFVFHRTQILAVIMATALHVAFYATLGISFWHLWVLFPALFLIRTSRQKNSDHDSR
jgi:hypothetical protein